MIHPEYLAERDLGGGRYAWVAPRLFGQADLIVGAGSEGFFCWFKKFNTPAEAIAAMNELDPENLPEGAKG